MQAGALVDLADVLGLAARFDGAAAAMLNAADIYAQKGNRVGEERAGAILTRFVGHAGTVGQIGV